MTNISNISRYPHVNDTSTDSWHDVRCTSVEVAALIWEAAGFDGALADQLWEYGSVELSQSAQELANESGEVLCWGSHQYTPAE